MAGGGALKAERSKRGKASKRKKMKRVSYHLDMTPLVDITFLLLTFFMFTTTMATPQVMEMSIPPEVVDQVEVKESELLQIFVRDDNKIFYAIGNEDPQEIELNKIRAMSEVENLREGKRNRMITAVKSSNDADYGTIVNILDELNMAEILITAEITKEFDEEGNPKKRERRFTIAQMSEEELEKIKEL